MIVAAPVRPSDVWKIHDSILETLGKPSVNFVAGGEPAPRPAGKPIYWDYTPRFGGEKAKEASRASRHRSWARLWQYRDRLAISCLLSDPEILRRGPIMGPLICLIDFYLPRPKKKGFSADIVSGRPDVKNLMFAVEDALSKPNPRRRLNYLWRGVWDDDCQSNTIAFRWHDDKPRTHVRVWEIGGS